MYLRDLTVWWRAKGEYDGTTFTVWSSHIEEIFRHFLPPKYVLTGQGKVVIEIATDGRPERENWNAMGVTHYPATGFSIRDYLSQPPSQQDDAVLQLIERSLIELAVEFGAGTQPIVEAAQKTRESGFVLRYPLSVSRWHPSKRYQGIVQLTYRRGGADVDVSINAKNGEVLFTEPLVADSNSYTIAHNLRRGVWEDQTFKIFDRSGHVFYAKNFSAILRGVGP